MKDARPIANEFSLVAADTDPKPKKQKKSIPSTPLINDAVKAVGDAVVKSKRKQTEDAPAQETPKKVKKSEAAPDAPKIAAKADEPVKEQTRKSKKSKKSKPSEDATATAVLDLPEDDNLNGGDEIVAVIEKKVKGSKKSKKSEPKPVEPSGDIEEDEDDEVDDDQTAALLAGFESEGDESEAEQEETSLDEKALMKQVPDGLTKELKGVSRKGQDTGVVFLGYSLLHSILRSLLTHSIVASRTVSTRSRSKNTSRSSATLTKSAYPATRRLALQSTTLSSNSPTPRWPTLWLRQWTNTSCLVGSYSAGL